MVTRNNKKEMSKWQKEVFIMKYETYFKLVLATGLRRGEACGLKWSDINWRKRTIHVQRGVVKLSHQESITKDPKTSSGDRMVYLSKEMCQLLKAWRKECEWDRAQTANETVSEDDYLFRQPNGKPMCPSTFTYRFKLILKTNNLPLDLSVHSLHHTNASLLISQGVDIEGVQPNQFTYNMAKYFDKVFEPKGIHYKTHRKNKVRLLSFYGDDGDGGDDDIDITQLSGWGIPERPSPSSPSSLGALEGSKHGRSVATGQPAEKPTGTAPNPCEAASA